LIRKQEAYDNKEKNVNKVLPIQTTWCYSRELFLSNFVLHVRMYV